MEDDETGDGEGKSGMWKQEAHDQRRAHEKIPLPCGVSRRIKKFTGLFRTSVSEYFTFNRWRARRGKQ